MSHNGIERSELITVFVCCVLTIGHWREPGALHFWFVFIWFSAHNALFLTKEFPIPSDIHYCFRCSIGHDFMLSSITHHVEKTVFQSFQTRLVLHVFKTYFGQPKLNSIVLDIYYDRYLAIDIAESQWSGFKIFFTNWA